ncbi:sensor histidine kinase [Calothrix sp. UHCC 0171]|uniref:sensor histidine kinase n=1 Tax=Calothrix sp. UHCC 0171 TaxID=3110245 RepID=UPI002B212918|nr:ATP-binding protein [Calothrix sp. UHCC 0171]MEA5569820.1 ATP-binding protein [Calothrix sp. UHCC 0171]
MYDIQKMTLRDMSECGLALRRLGDDALTMEEVSNNIIHYLNQNFVDSSSHEKACVLIRFFKTHSYRELTPDLQEYASQILRDRIVSDHLKCLTLLATAGELPEWNSRYQSVGHQAIPLVDEDAIARIPMISQLIQQLGIDTGTVVQPDPNFLADLEQKMYNVFYVPNALDSPYIPAQAAFVAPFNVKSVLGFGGLLPSGNMFTILMFLKVFIPPMVLDLFRPLALSIKMAILPFDDGYIFKEDIHSKINAEIAEKTHKQSRQYLNSQIATLNQLLDVSEKSTIIQSDRLEDAIANLHQVLDKLQNTQMQLIQTEKMSSLSQMIAGIAHEINNPVNFIQANVSYTEEYTESLLRIVKLYQQNYPNPPAEIQQIIKKIELDFMTSDLKAILKSMKLGTERIRNIVISLRNFSRLDEAEFKTADIHSGIDSTLMILHNRLKVSKKNDSEIQVVKNYGNLPLIECYPGQMNQVFMNIISNAIDALELGVGEEFKSQNPQISICTQVIDEQWIAITIADNGVGMTEAVMSKLFDPFFTTKPVGKGTGLGLSISYQIVVEKHCGDIICHSQPGQGTKFTIKIPTRNLHG